ncbi:hypothetical protein [Paenibacillus apiarius]|uniref:Uncharacterized protein n=1 Tax=Paenibacillus apiarius TaxID=46240 RepID=A0ABT4DVQ7_9BACL|nr:hypothetical protein [Paenibacillus apiarius]MCY9513222.1 hypothetical protein [Paenibacillus apiarius]MCY9521419.1 hypothetical protein [Paenibacillus apiarius]MCY9554435.1 hypothetical protein [Paenibacillus apiarius]MCY9560638.1 hypothetical protein [Paenibacillus apiarius]MCY9685111.1 hypothetical protein [Paenibacillus apiarius]
MYSMIAEAKTGESCRSLLKQNGIACELFKVRSIAEALPINDFDFAAHWDRGDEKNEL